MALLRTVNLTKRFGDFRAINSVNFSVNRGEFLSLVGSNGAGKTTLVNLISAQLKPDTGQILFEDRDITQSSVSQRIRAGIARSFQLVNLFDGLTVLDNVSLAIFAREGKLWNLATLAEGDQAVRAEAMEVLGLFGLETKRKLLAGALAQGATSGVGTRDKAQIMDTVSAVVRAGTVTAVVIEHDMDIVFKYSDRVVVMHEGVFLADGLPAEIRANKEVATVLLGAPMPT